MTLQHGIHLGKDVDVGIVYRAYFDASGHPADSEVVFVSGCVSTTSKWQRFEIQWIKLLNSYRFTPPFHMKEFVHRRNQYAHLKDDAAKEFIGLAAKIIKSNTHKSFGAGVVVKDLERLNAEYEIPDTKEADYEPYAFCGLAVCLMVYKWMKKNARPIDRIGMIFEHGDQGRGLFSDRMLELWDFRPTFLNKKDCIPFQAADLLAWEHRRVLNDNRAGKPRPRTSYSTLRRLLPSAGSWIYYDFFKLSKYCEEKGFGKRTLK